MLTFQNLYQDTAEQKAEGGQGGAAGSDADTSDEMVRGLGFMV